MITYAVRIKEEKLTDNYFFDETERDKAVEFYKTNKLLRKGDIVTIEKMHSANETAKFNS